MIFTWLLVAAGLHLIEEYVYPGGFLRWIRSAVGFAPNLAEAVLINAAFLALVAAPVVASPGPIFTLSVPGLLLTNAPDACRRHGCDP
jgi:hypothetical protein